MRVTKQNNGGARNLPRLLAGVRGTLTKRQFVAKLGRQASGLYVPQSGKAQMTRLSGMVPFVPRLLPPVKL